MQITTYGPDAKQISAQVARVLASRVFIRSPRLCGFFRFVVDQTLKGNLSQLKEQIIGVEIYDRKVDYDNRVDPIVRMEARRLRDKLKAYYRSTGRGDQIVIGLPKGAYLPLFKLRSNTPPKPRETSSRSPTKQSILVIPIENLTQDTKDDYFSVGLTQELTHLLTRIPVLRVVAWASSSFQSGTTPANLAGRRQLLLVDTILRGSVRRSVVRSEKCAG